MKVEKIQRTITMIAVLLFILMISFPATATAQPQYAGTEPVVQSPYSNPYQSTMVSPNATQGLMNSGSKYVSMTVDLDGNGSMDGGTAQSPTGPRRVNDNPYGPFPDPIGDAALPLALCALAYLIVRVARKRARAKGAE